MPILLQGFNWNTHAQGTLYKKLKSMSGELKSFGITHVWYPPVSKSRDKEGYYPIEYYDLNSAYGNSKDLSESVRALKTVGIESVADIVSWYEFDGYKRDGFIFSKRKRSIDDPRLFSEFSEYVKLLTSGIGFGGIRVDCLKTYPSNELGMYLSSDESFQDVMMIGELWETMNYDVHHMEYDQSTHRQSIVDYVDRTNGRFHMFDFTTKGILQEAVNKNEYWRLIDDEKRPPGAIGYWPEKCITFIDNHDTLGQHLWAFSYDYDKVLIGYAYILTHPGTPCVYIDHYESHKDSIRSLIALRNMYNIHEGSSVEILEATNDKYAALIDGVVIVELGCVSHYGNDVFAANGVAIRVAL